MANHHDLVDLTLLVFFATDKAIKVGEDDEDRNLPACWLPLSQVEVEYTGKTSIKGYPVAIVTMSEWLAIDKKLV
jgi:hypothetical protein